MHPNRCYSARLELTVETQIRPRRGAWVGIGCLCLLAAAPILVGVVTLLAGHPDGISSIVLGLPIAVWPVAYFFRAEVKLADGILTKNGLLRKAGSCPTDDLGSIEAYTKVWSPSTGGGRLTSEGYEFREKYGTVIFKLSTNWWSPKDIAQLGQQLGIRITEGEAAEEQNRIARNPGRRGTGRRGGRPEKAI